MNKEIVLLRKKNYVEFKLDSNIESVLSNKRVKQGDLYFPLPGRSDLLVGLGAGGHRNLSNWIGVEGKY